jgi:stearoyl-CoA desaturase (delta-9 desaturase)
MFSGIFDLPWWGYVLYTLAVTHVTIAAVTIFLHRHQAHRALDLHPVVSHFFRFWLWLTTGMLTKEWAAIHRKHHARCETAEDPHSPQVLGINKVLWEGAELYRRESLNQETLERFGHGTPDDWLERRVYTPHSVLGVALMLIVNFALFGFIGLSIWAVQMAWIPFFAAGVINGIGHYWGYRNFHSEDASRNILPWGILIGGEELHNNHHAYPSSAKFSSRRFEFDLGWLYIRTMELLRLARVKKVAPRVKLGPAKPHCDAALLQAVITHRYDVLTRYARSLGRAYAAEKRRLGKALARVSHSELRRLMLSDPAELTPSDRARLDALLSDSKALATAYELRQELSTVWARSNASREQLVKQLEDWCARAEASGIAALQEFSLRLRSYA